MSAPVSILSSSWIFASTFSEANRSFVFVQYGQYDLLNTTTLFCSISDFAKSAADDILRQVLEKARLVDGWAALKEDADEMESVIVRSGRNKFILRQLDLME
jgi:hypothetical protein